MTEYEVAKQIFKDTGMAMLWLTVALLGATALLGLLIWMFRREKFDTYKKSALGVWIGYSISVIVVMTYLSFRYNGLDPDLEHDLVNAYIFKPVLAMVLVAVSGAVLMYVLSFFNKKLVKAAGALTLLAEIGAFVAAMVLMTKYYNESENTSWYPSMNTVGLIVSAVVFAALIGVFYIIGNKRKEENNTKALVYGAISVAMSFALSYIKMFEMPQGGSITFASLLPLMIYCCMFGTRRGLTVCVIYGVLQAVQNPWIIHPMQFLLDYPLAFGLVGISGLFMEKGLFKKHRIIAFLLGGVLAVTLRFACHVLSGLYAFADYADVDRYGSVLVYSMAYNSFAFIDMVIALAAGSVLFASKTFRAQMSRSGAAHILSASEDQPYAAEEENGFGEETDGSGLKEEKESSSEDSRIG